jgi:hypothetical protein
VIGPGGLLLIVSHLFAVPVLILWVGMKKKKRTKLECKKHFCKATYCAAGNALSLLDSSIIETICN